MLTLADFSLLQLPDAVQCHSDPEAAWTYPAISSALQATALSTTLQLAQERLVSIVAGWMLDRNNSAKLDASVSADYAANLEHNVADAVARLPKLTTGRALMRERRVPAHQIAHMPCDSDALVWSKRRSNLVHSGSACAPVP